MMKQDQAAALIESAERLFHAQGYTATGARQVATAAGLPVGSFTNHFRSKDVLGEAALARYFARLNEMMVATLGDATLSPRDRLLAYFTLIADRLGEADWARGCLVPDLATEAPMLGDRLRARLVEALHAQSGMFEAALREAMPERDAADLAGFVLAAWHGTMLRMKVERSSEAVDRFRRVLTEMLPIQTASPSIARI